MGNIYFVLEKTRWLDQLKFWWNRENLPHFIKNVPLPFLNINTASITVFELQASLIYESKAYYLFCRICQKQILTELTFWLSMSLHLVRNTPQTIDGTASPHSVQSRHWTLQPSHSGYHTVATSRKTLCVATCRTPLTRLTGVYTALLPAILRPVHHFPTPMGRVERLERVSLTYPSSTNAANGICYFAIQDVRCSFNFSCSKLAFAFLLRLELH